MVPKPDASGTMGMGCSNLCVIKPPAGLGAHPATVLSPDTSCKFPYVCINCPHTYFSDSLFFFLIRSMFLNRLLLDTLILFKYSQKVL